MKKIIGLFLLLILISLVLTSCSRENPYLINDKYCEKDSDCIKAECCHASSCVNIEHKPNCSGVMCTMECKPNTMDCGAGSCVCENNNCVVK